MSSLEFLRRRASRAALVLPSLALVMACGEKKDDDKVPLGAAPAAAPGAPHGTMAAKPEADLSEAAKAALDAGNAAFRKKDFAAALAAYDKAAKASPEHAAPWFGIYMVAKATNDTKAAEAALTEIRKRNEAPPVEHMTPDSAAMNKAHAKAGVPSTKS